MIEVLSLFLCPPFPSRHNQASAHDFKVGGAQRLGERDAAVAGIRSVGVDAVGGFRGWRGGRGRRRGREGRGESVDCAVGMGMGMVSESEDGSMCS